MKPVVLIADDSAFIREALGGALRSESVAVREARNGQEALALLETAPDIRAAILDVSMPIQGGVDVLRALDRSTRPSLFVVAIGTRSEQGLLEECRRLGADATLTKPLDVESVCDVLNRALERA